MNNTSISKPDPLVTMTNFEFRVWQMRDRGIGHIVAATGKSERAVSAAFNRAHDKDLEQRARSARQIS